MTVLPSPVPSFDVLIRHSSTIPNAELSIIASTIIKAAASHYLCLGITVNVPNRNRINDCVPSPVPSFDVLIRHSSTIPNAELSIIASTIIKAAASHYLCLGITVNVPNRNRINDCVLVQYQVLTFSFAIVAPFQTQS